jgi:hypothetical protein
MCPPTTLALVLVPRQYSLRAMQFSRLSAPPPDDLSMALTPALWRDSVGAGRSPSREEREEKAYALTMGREKMAHCMALRACLWH